MKPTRPARRSRLCDTSLGWPGGSSPSVRRQPPRTLERGLPVAFFIRHPSASPSRSCPRLPLPSFHVSHRRVPHPLHPNRRVLLLPIPLEAGSLPSLSNGTLRRDGSPFPLGVWPPVPRPPASPPPALAGIPPRPDPCTGRPARRRVHASPPRKYCPPPSPHLPRRSHFLHPPRTRAYLNSACVHTDLSGPKSRRHSLDSQASIRAPSHLTPCAPPVTCTIGFRLITRWSRPGQPVVGFGAILAWAGRAAHLDAVRRCSPPLMSC